MLIMKLLNYKPNSLIHIHFKYGLIWAEAVKQQ